jgi:hypothetical protein
LLVSFALLVLAASVSSSASHPAIGMMSAGSVLLSLQVLAACGVSVVYRWCFARPPVRGAALLASALVTVFVLSHEPLLAVFKTLTTEAHMPAMTVPLCISIIVDGYTVVGVAIAICMVGVLLIEAPLRWAQGDRTIVTDGAFRVFRAVAFFLLFLGCSALIRADGVARLVALVKRAVA